jgi:hypothetical protein
LLIAAAVTTAETGIPWSCLAGATATGAPAGLVSETFAGKKVLLAGGESKTTTTITAD